VHHFSKELFRKCLMSVSANCEYVDWLVGRNLASGIGHLSTAG
jgi:hypothetical protein